MDDKSDDRAVAELSSLFTDPADVTAALELAEAERAVTRHAASPEQAAGVAVVAGLRRPEERVRAWRELRRQRL